MPSDRPPSTPVPELPGDGTIGSDIAEAQALGNEAAETELISGVARSEADSFGRDRTMIGKIVIYVFAGAVVLTLLYIVFVPSFLTNSGIDGQTGARLMIEVLGSILLPVVTLIIGFYFGEKKSDG
jgi:hypothetical protein